MGKIKDLQNKKKAAKIYSSGGGGGKAAPIDKLNQEHPCPRCDRVFKQKGRLQEHIKNQHKEDTQEAEGQGEQLHASSSSPSPSGVKLQNPQAGVRVQDVGTSGGGYFSHKSPKLHLLEWTKKQRMRKPIYRPSSNSDGKWLCKVVLPDVQNPSKDIVTFLDADLAANTKEEAEQRGAAAMLANVAGERGYGRVFPPDHITLWDTLVGRFKEKQERRRAAMDVQERKEKRAANRQAKLKAQVAVVMSEEHRNAVESAVQELRKGGGSQCADPLQAQESGQPSGSGARGSYARLEQMGFSAANIDGARNALGENASVSEMLDWLCLHLPENELPRSMASSSRTNKVEVIKTTPPLQKDIGIDHPSLARMVTYGYYPNEVEAALIEANLDEDEALRRLYGGLTGVSVCSEPYKEPAEEDSEWQEEAMALEAIYGEQAVFPSSSCVTLLNRIPAMDISNLDIEEDEVELRLTVTNIGPGYPQELPVVVCESVQLTHEIIRATTAHVARKSCELSGFPMVHELLTTACEFLACMPEGGVSRDEEILADVGNTAESEIEKVVEDSSSGEHLRPVGGKGGGRGHMKGSRSRWSISPAEAKAENERLKLRQTEYNGGNMSKMRSVRERLPAASQRKSVVDTIAASQVVIITGMPGCGKSTQIPQFLFEEAIDSGHGCECNIICTQPRRISALGLASRVSEERGESCGDVVGYSIRNQTSRSKRTRIMFCTTGVLLRQMISDPRLSGISHVLVDEVHERSVEMDLLLLLLKENLKRKGKCHKIVLMSATANAEDFSNYFSSVVAKVPIVHIPGFTHPVREFLLESALQMTGMELPDRGQANKRNVRPGQDKDEDDDNGEEVALHAARKPSRKLIAAMEHMEIGYDVIVAIVAHIIEEESQHGPAALLKGWTEFENGGGKLQADGKGAILIFMPGSMEISRLAKKISESPLISNSSVRILQLHASLPSSQQTRVFEKMPPRVRKIVISTNVAETSVTIPDVTVVIDTCLAKEVGYDAERRMSRLQLDWVSQASAKQRAGRAGRVQCGVCFRLVTGTKWKNMRSHTPPEIMRIPLEPLCMNVIALLKDGSKLEHQLRQCITPPASGQVHSAVRTLREVGALDTDLGLTSLGSHLVRMPVDCRVGKMLIYGAMLQCLDPVLTIAAAMSYGRPMFLSPQEKREEASAKRKELYAPYAPSKSDHMAMVAAFLEWQNARRQGGDRAGYAFSREHFLSEDVMQATLSAKKEFARILADIGFVSIQYAEEVGRGSNSTFVLDQFASNSRFVRAALCAGHYPAVLRVENPPKKFVQVAAGAKEVEGDSKLVKLFDRERGRVFMHPASINFGVTHFESGWVVFSNMVETAKVYVRQCSMVPVYGMLVFGGELAIQHEQGTMTLDGWARFKAPPKIGVLIKELRSGVSALLSQKITEPDLDLSSSAAVHAVMKLLETDGF